VQVARYSITNQLTIEQFNNLTIPSFNNFYQAPKLTDNWQLATIWAQKTNGLSPTGHGLATPLKKTGS
jgi:hypothetical protein